MTNYNDLPLIPISHHELKQYTFNKETPDDIDQQLTQIIISLIKQHGFNDYDPQCVILLQTCFIDFYKDLLTCFKQHLESLGSSTIVQDIFKRTLTDVMSINLRQLHRYMKRKSQT